MATLSEYFDTEARDTLRQMTAMLADAADTAELHRLTRALRGTAQMAREERVYRAMLAFEAVTRALASDALTWSADVAARAADTLDDLEALVAREEEDALLDARATATIERWRNAGLDLPAGESTPAAASGTREFREYVAREGAAIADALETGVQQLAADPMDREPLKMILRRQRALLGAARLEEIPVVAEILRAIEDLTRVIAKLDVGVKQEWLDIYRVAREGLKTSVESLERDEDPVASHALSRLRHLREELLDRYGAGEAVSAAHQSPGLVQATQLDPHSDPDAVGAPGGMAPSTVEPAARAAASRPGAAPSSAPPVEHASGPTVSIEELYYRGESALRRALELRSLIEQGVEEQSDARAAVDELFDLLRLALR